MERYLVLVTSSFPIVGDGREAAGSFVADLAEALAVHVPLLVVAPGPQALREKWSDRIEVLRYRAPPWPLSTFRPWKLAHISWVARVLYYGLATTRTAVGDDAAHVLALWGLPCGEWARRAARARGIGYSVWMLGSDVWSLGRVPVLRGWLARVIRESACAYADGHQLAEDAQRIAGVPVEFLPSTRTIGLIDPPPPHGLPPYRLLFLGRWHHNKGVDLLMDALRMLNDTDWSRIECVEIQGGGPLEQLVREQGDLLRACGRPVEVGRYLNKSQAEAAVVRADWVLIPSRIESIPVVFSDAMKLRRPVIATPVGDMPRLLAGHPVGVCSRDATAVAFAAALRAVLGSASIGCATAFADVAAQFSLDRAIVPKILAVLDERKPHTRTHA
jgi:glycosyltransferase involved in cell wall biosynthesis